MLDAGGLSREASVNGQRSSVNEKTANRQPPTANRQLYKRCGHLLILPYIVE
jgi:hypothetical protein